MVAHIPLAVDTSVVPNRLVRFQSTDVLTGVQDLDPSGNTDGRDVSQDGADLDAHRAAAAPHSGHPTNAQLATVAGALTAHEAAAAPHSGHATDAELAAVAAAAEQLANKGQPNGYPELDVNGKVPANQLPPSGSGDGDVTGPASVAAGQPVAVFADTTGKVIAETPVKIAANGNITGAGTFNGADVGTVAAQAAAAVAAAATAQAEIDAHEAAAAPHSGHATDAELATVAGVAGAAASAAATAQAEIDAHEAAASPHSGHLTGGSNLSSSGVDVPPVLEEALSPGVASQLLQLYRIAGELGMTVKRTGNSLRISRRPSLWAPRERSRFEGYAAVEHGGRKTAGAIGDVGASGPDYLPADLIAHHGSTDHLWPFMVYTGVATDGIVHKFHAGLRGSFSPTSAVKGFEFGHPIRKGHGRIGRGAVWNLEGEAENVGWMDAFWEFVVELNPVSGTFNGANRLRLLSPELDRTWSGERHWKARIELAITGPASCALHGEWTIYGSTGAVLRCWEREAALASGVDWLGADQRLGMRWRVEKDLATNADVYTGENQGARQGANLLRCHVDRYKYQPVGFRQE